MHNGYFNASAPAKKGLLGMATQANVAPTVSLPQTNATIIPPHCYAKEHGSIPFGCDTRLESCHKVS